MATSNNDKYEKLLVLHKTLVDAITATEVDVNQCSLEWLQLCDISKSQNKTDKIVESGPEVNNKLVLTKMSALDIEDTRIINIQPIDVNIKSIKEDKVSEEEFDSD